MQSKQLTNLKSILDERLGSNSAQSASCVYLPAQSTMGFDASFCENFHEYTIHFNGWCQHFIKSNYQDAMHCFLYTLTHHSRVKVFSKGGMRYKWQLQFRENGRWVTYTTTMLWLHPFWKKVQVEYLQNAPLEELFA